MALFDPKSKAIASCQRSIEEKKRTIVSYYDQIGRLYYDQYKNFTDVTEDINDKCETVGKLFDEINDLELRIIFEKGLKLCPNCKKENNLEYAFCFACGTKFSEESCTMPGTTNPVQVAVEKLEGKVTEKAEKVIDADDVTEELVEVFEDTEAETPTEAVEETAEDKASEDESSSEE